MTFEALSAAYLRHLQDHKQASGHTVDSYRRDLRALQAALSPSEAASVEAISATTLEAYLARLATTSAVSSRRRAISSIRQLFLFAQRAGHIHESPARRLLAPPQIRAVPRVPTEAEAAQLLDSLAGDDRPKTLRDRCALELLYSCGVRATELCELTLADVDLEGLTVRLGLQKEERRTVPMGEAAKEATRAYLARGREPLLQGRSHPYLLVANHGQPMTRMVLFAMVQKRGDEAQLGLRLSPHTLRHAFARHLLDNGADLRAVQKMLGHKSVATTEMYVQGGEAGLKDTIDAHHPLSHGHAQLEGWLQRPDAAATPKD